MAYQRRQARILAMQALCQWDVQQDSSSEMLRDLADDQGASDAASRYAAQLVESFWAERDDVDQRIAVVSERWTLSRMSPVERNVMRVAVVELMGGDTPPKVAINEAIEIGKEFGGQESPRFINGILDEVLRRTAQGTTDGA